MTPNGSFAMVVMPSHVASPRNAGRCANLVA